MTIKVWNGTSFVEVAQVRVSLDGDKWSGLVNSAYVWNGSSWVKFWPAVYIAPFQTSQNNSLQGIGGTATATIRLGSDGKFGINTGGNTIVDQTGQWLVNPSVSSASDYEVQGSFTGSGGTVSGPTGYVNLGTTREWTLTATNQNVLFRSLLLDFRKASTASPVTDVSVNIQVRSAP